MCPIGPMCGWFGWSAVRVVVVPAFPCCVYAHRAALAVVVSLGYFAVTLLISSTFLTTCWMHGSRSTLWLLKVKTMAKHLRAELGPITSAMAVLSACMALFDPFPTSVPYRAAGRMVVAMVVSFDAWLVGSHLSLRTFLWLFESSVSSCWLHSSCRM